MDQGPRITSLDELEKQAAKSPGDLQVMRRLAWGYYTAGRLEEARRTLEEALKRFPKDEELQYTLGLTLKRMGDLEKAKMTFQGLLDVIALDASTRSRMLRSLAESQITLIERQATSS